MVNFRAEERGQMANAKPGANKVPEAPAGALVYLGAAKAFIYDTDHDFQDVIRPGYFDPCIERNGNSYLGALVWTTCKGGKKDPEDWTTALLRVARVRGSRGYSSEEPSLVAIVQRFSKATLCAHDGTPAKDKAA